MWRPPATIATIEAIPRAMTQRRVGRGSWVELVMRENDVSWFDGRGATVAARQRVLGLPEDFSARPPFERDREGSLFEAGAGASLRLVGRGADITASRWMAAKGEPQSVEAVTPDWCHIVTIALRTSRVTGRPTS